MRGYLAVLGALAGVLLSTAAFAQGGSITGMVRDTSGAVLPGVTVEVASPALIEKSRSAVTDGSGQYRIVDLRPGTYTVTATLTGFNTFKRDGIEISGIAVVTINADLKVGSIEETVTVSGETPVVDLQSTTKERVMSKDVIDALPTGRVYNALGVLIPGVNSNRGDVGGAQGDTMASLTAHGSTEGDQRILQNGLNIMTLVTAGGNIGGTVPNTSAAQEVVIDTSGASAERQTGGVNINFIPRDGGNTFRGSMFATGTSESFQSNNVTQDLRDQGLSDADRLKVNWDFNPGVGGPILRDRLWFYITQRNSGAHNYAGGIFYNQNEFQPNLWTYVPANGLNGAVRRQALSTHTDWWDTQTRLTWQINPTNKIAGTWDQQGFCRCPRPPNVVPILSSPESYGDARFEPSRLLHAEWWSPLTSRLLLEFVALHRTERYGTMTPRPGTFPVTAAQFAQLPYMIGVTQTNGTVGVPNGLSFHGPAETFSNNFNANYTYRWAMSYITGAHAFKVGGQDSFGYTANGVELLTLDAFNRPVRYRFASQNTPDQVTAYHVPYSRRNADLNHDLGLFVQDRWTRNRLTVNAGMRFDWFQADVPSNFLFGSTLGRPATTFDAIPDVVNWKDWTPRVGASYDLKGDGKTALKVTLNKYVAGQGIGGLPTSANPINRLTHSASRNWTDLNGDRVVNCDLSVAGAQSPGTTGSIDQCGATNAAFATGSVAIPGADASNPSGLTDFNVRRGWGVRSYNWEFSAGVQRELMPRVSVDVSYFRRWFGNFTATDNLALGPSDFRYFNITAPRDTRLPGGGGYSVTGFTDFTSIAAANATPINRTVFADDLNADQISHWNGVDVNVSARLQNGLLLQGGTSTGRRSQNNCGVASALPETLGNNPLEHCDQVEPFLTQVKAVGAYTLPRYERLPATLGRVLQSVQVAATFQSIPGNPLLATFSMNAAELTANSTLGSGLINGGTKVVQLIKPSAVYDDRLNQLDLRIGRIMRFYRTRTSLNFDIFNLTNANTVLQRNTALTKTAGDGSNNQVLQADGLAHTLWVPSSILQARFYKLSATFDF